MKAITLTEDQKDKLLEMCKTLFSEYTTIPSDKNPKYISLFSQSNLGVFVVLSDDEKQIQENIHWLEFCMIDLVEKLLYKENEKQSQFYLTALSYKRGVINIHPVDYLYKEFKKLK